MWSLENLKLEFEGRNDVEEFFRNARSAQNDEARYVGARAVIDALAEVAPESVSRVDTHLRKQLADWRPEPKRAWLSRCSGDLALGEELHSASDGLEFLFLSHPDGRLREWALHKLVGGLPTPYAFALVALRLNDWVEPVRLAAVDCVLRTYPQTSSDIAARAALHVIASSQSWRRWTMGGESLDAAIAASGAAGALVERIRDARAGPYCRLLRQALRGPSFDHGLIELATRARIPHVRAVALRTLIEGRASWISGYGKQWIDKTMGEFRRAPVFAHRQLTDPLDRGEMIALGARDASAAVRRTAVDALATHWREFADVAGLVGLFKDDDRPPVRERIDFVRRRLAERDGVFDRDATAGAG